MRRGYHANTDASSGLSENLSATYSVTTYVPGLQMATAKKPFLDTQGTREYKYAQEISQMMFVFGEVQDPNPETVNLVEDIVRSQLIELVSTFKLSVQNGTLQLHADYFGGYRSYKHECWPPAAVLDTCRQKI